jgi:hypothetical protein
MNKPIGVGVKPSQTHNHVCFQQSNITLARRLLPVREGSTKSYHPVHAGTIFRRPVPMPPPLFPCLVGAPGHWIHNKPTQRSIRAVLPNLKGLAEARWNSAGLPQYLPTYQHVRLLAGRAPHTKRSLGPTTPWPPP